MSALLASDANDQLFLGPVLVNGRRIPEQEIYAEMQYHPAETPREAIYAAARSLVLAELLRERAHECGLCDSDIDVSSEAFDEVIEQLLEREVPELKATREQRLDHFAANRQKFRSQPLAEVRHILLAVKPDDEGAHERQRDLAETLLEQIRNAPDPLLQFAQLARQHSDCSSRDADGSLGQVGPGDTVAPFEEAVFAGDTGLVEQPVPTKYGWHLIYVEQLEPGRPLEFSYVEEKIGYYLREKLRRQMIDVFLTELVCAADISGIDMLDVERVSEDGRN
ncbi:peptidyl-prolyl cis-trans isomerase C [Microbulbifer donghaiensis]|uniref:peptidylprolyl isomerase n=1 Tax=Microbulbifer donghaiensis TaxID=494016 RepID=A0A1M4YT21_9GAMM|nr:foldase protein PrsA [Microbulbifer donghaiensis]SHF08915.1 peptidyl-prolyl cis-trans isomerase C [Microbulbifer donghaiensis]